MSNYRFTILIRQGVSRSYFRLNASLFSIGPLQILLQDSFVKFDYFFSFFCLVCWVVAFQLLAIYFIQGLNNGQT